MVDALAKSPRWQGRRGPVVLMIMDGVGYGKYAEGDAVAAANTPNLDWLHAHCPHTQLMAHGTAVGLPSDEDMGNSEVGHNAIGCGRIFAQGAKLVNAAIAEGRLFAGTAWQELVENCRKHDSTLHFIGLFSDGNVHSHLDHLKAMLVEAKRLGLKRVRIHTLLDGRDVPATSALDYVIPFEAFLAELNADGAADFRLASGGGRMVITMDRYGANWDMVRKGWETHVHGQGRGFATTQQAIETLRTETGAIDQDLPPWVIVDDQQQPVGPIRDGDSVVFFNFRGDRALEITAAFENDDFDKFDRSPRPDVLYAGMMQYDGDLLAPKRFLVSPPAIDRTLSEFLCASKVPCLAVSETQKFGHVTYFFNGNRSDKFDEQLETYVEIPSDIVPFEQRPWMKGAEITDEVVAAIAAGKQRFIRMNYPNGDMVGHTGVYPAALCAMAALDLCLGRVMAAVRKAGGVLLVSADHGNCDDMFEHQKKTGATLLNADGTPVAKTAHSLNPVPCLVFDPEAKGEYLPQLREGLGISSLAATAMELLGFVPPDDYTPSVLQRQG
jgi:2,3-bisphosphoglycerate-independent phosphoglycerate mutase